MDGVGAAWQLPLTTNGRSIVYKLDTGAQANILPFAEYQRLDPRPSLHEIKTCLFAYGVECSIQLKGHCVCDVTLPGGDDHKLRFYVLASTVRAVPLLGLTARDQLNLVKRIEAAVPELAGLDVGIPLRGSS